MEPENVDFNDSPQDDVKTLIAELRSLVFSDIGGLYDENNCLKDIKDMPEALRRSIASIEVDEIFQGSGHMREKIGETKKVKLWDKKGAIDSFMRHLGLFIERLEVKQDVNIRVEQIDLDQRIEMLTKARQN